MRFALLLICPASCLPLLAFDPPQPRLVKDINARVESLGSFPSEFTRVGNTVFFRAMDPTHGHELWKTDGTVLGTVLVKDLLSGSGGGYPRNLKAVGDMLFLTASSSTGLWVMDGVEWAVLHAPRGTCGAWDGARDAVGIRKHRQANPMPDHLSASSLNQPLRTFWSAGFTRWRSKPASLVCWRSCSLP